MYTLPQKYKYKHFYKELLLKKKTDRANLHGKSKSKDD